MEKDVKTLIKTLEKHNQGHLLRFWEDLDGWQREGLVEQIKKLDLAQIDTWVEEYVRDERAREVPQHIEPASES